MRKLLITFVAAAMLVGAMGSLFVSPLFMASGSEDPDCPTQPPRHPGAPAAMSADTMAGDTFDALSDEQLEIARIIHGVAAETDVPEFGLVVAYATAMQESRMRNLDYGDRDSGGVFQQRPSTGWGSWGQVTDPTFATRAFFGGAHSPHWRGPSGRAEPPGLRDIVGWDQMTVTQAAQAVQRSAFPNAYAQWEPLARQLVAHFGDGGGDVGGPNPCGPGGAMVCDATGHPAEEGLTPDALRVLRCLNQHHPLVAGFAGVADRPTNPNSDHPSGRAVDAIMPKGGPGCSCTTRGVGDAVAAWLVDHAPALGVKYVIWWEQIWKAEQSDKGWQPYEHPSGLDDDTHAHRDHVHVSVYGNAAGGEPGTWTVPVKGDYTKTAGFGQCGRIWVRCHTGQDLAAPTTRPIVAASAGTVTTVADLGSDSYGRYVVITHSGGTETWYAHLEAFAPSIRVGVDVTTGQLIGYMGSTGNSTGRHLHFEVRPAGARPVDPVPWMSAQGANL